MGGRGASPIGIYPRGAGVRQPHRSVVARGNPRRPARGEAGVTASVVVAIVMALVTVAAIGVLALAYSAAARSVRAAADLAAVSGAQAYARGDDACAEARRIAERNQAGVSGCEVAGDLIDFVVEVRVSRGVVPPLPGLPGRVAATAYAGTVTGMP